MTADELKARVIGLVIRKHALTEEQVKLADSAADEALDSYRKRDESVSGTGVAPYNFQESLVYWLERQIMQRVGL